MSGISDMRAAFSHAAGNDVTLLGARVSRNKDGDQVVEFDAASRHGPFTHTDTLPAGADTVALTAAAVRLGTRAREQAVTGVVIKTPTEHAVDHIKSGDYQLVSDEPGEMTYAKPPVFF